MIDRPSPNWGLRPDTAPIDMLVLHYTGMETADAALTRLCDPEAEVSAHYLIDADGTLYRLVAEAHRAWHAGVACWAGERDVNSRSIGVELVNPGHDLGYRPFPEAQMAALEGLAGAILARHRVPAHRVLGHSDVAPNRKQDPGELFDWQRLAAAGIGIWPQPDPALNLGFDLRATQQLLADFGYDLAPSGSNDPQSDAVIRAFHRHFRPDAVDAPADEWTQRLAADLCRQAGIRV